MRCEARGGGGDSNPSNPPMFSAKIANLYSDIQRDIHSTEDRIIAGVSAASRHNQEIQDESTADSIDTLSRRCFTPTGDIEGFIVQ